MDPLLRRELVEAGLRLRKIIARAVNETPEWFPEKEGKWSVEFRNPETDESITVIYTSIAPATQDKHVN
jgi:hypothetical protein